MKIEHIAIWVKHLENSCTFYETYFGGVRNEVYENSTKGYQSYFLTFDTGSRLELMHRPDVHHDEDDKLLRGGVVHFAFSVGAKEKVDQLTERLRTDGFEVLGEPRTTGDGYYESVVADPDGNPVEITI